MNKRNFVDGSKRTHPVFIFVVTLGLSSHLRLTTAIAAMTAADNITMITIHAVNMVKGPHSPVVKSYLFEERNPVHLSGMGQLMTKVRS